MHSRADKLSCTTSLHSRQNWRLPRLKMLCILGISLTIGGRTDMWQVCLSGKICLWLRVNNKIKYLNVLLNYFHTCRVFIGWAMLIIIIFSNHTGMNGPLSLMLHQLCLFIKRGSWYSVIFTTLVQQIVRYKMTATHFYKVTGLQDRYT